MLAESRKRILGPATPPEAGQGRKITPEQVQTYLKAAGGDKDIAREAARKDEWKF